ncbi:MAG: hypothetical protein P8P36_04875 [Akkermansiaceae bacterium]|nr:hypothetical protein [Akkermansiaceae bacterium]
MAQERPLSRHQCTGYFWATVARDHWPKERAHIDRVWKGENGDCWQEIMSDEGKREKLFTYPFPKWKMGIGGS